MSRRRVAPLIQISIPTLELCSAIQAVRLDALMYKEIDIPFLKSTFFTESEIVRAYIHNKSLCYETFAVNHVIELRRQSSSDQWHHVDGQVNQSDVLSHGCDGDRIPGVGARVLHLHASTSMIGHKVRQPSLLKRIPSWWRHMYWSYCQSVMPSWQIVAPTR